MWDRIVKNGWRSLISHLSLDCLNIQGSVCISYSLLQSNFGLMREPRANDDLVWALISLKVDFIDCVIKLWCWLTDNFTLFLSVINCPWHWTVMVRPWKVLNEDFFLVIWFNLVRDCTHNSALLWRLHGSYTDCCFGLWDWDAQSRLDVIIWQLCKAAVI
jgi:hypothetical protein